MTSKRLLLATGVGLALALALLGLLGQGANVARADPAGTIRWVASDGSDSGPCTVDPCCTVQYAVDVANPGDEIRVATGIYTGVQARHGLTQVVYLSKTMTIRGGFASDFSDWNPDSYLTVLDAERQGHVVCIIGDGSPVIEGFHIAHGDAEASGGSYGGGVFAAGSSGPSLTVTLRHNHIISNHATTASPSSGGYGAGLSFIFSNAVLEGNYIQYNETDGSGGGLRMEQSNGRLRDNVIRYNRAVGANTGSGGGIYLNFASVSMINTVIADNEVSHGGGGMVAAGAYAQMIHTTLARNNGGDGSGIYVVLSMFGGPATVSMTNSIVVSHGIGITVTPGAYGLTNTADLNGVLWYANKQNIGGGGIITVTQEHTGTPAFAADGYHLGPSSAAINRGVEAGVATDIDGDSRPIGPASDLGADEARWWVFLPLLFRNIQG